MAEPDSDPRNTLEDEDLEDGEIETDEENDEGVQEKPAPKPVAIEPVKRVKEEESKKISETRTKTEQHKSTTEIAAKNKKPSNDANPQKGKYFSKKSGHTPELFGNIES